MPRRFGTTEWSLVLAAADGSSDEGGEALDGLCRTYWLPVYAYLRRRGADPDRARDLTQGFFTTLIEKNFLAAADRERGRFRTFLLSAVSHWAANEWDRERAQKRGGDREFLSFDGGAAETALALDPGHDETPERLFDRRWARALLDRATATVLDEAARAGDDARRRAAALLPFVAGSGDGSYREVGERLGLRETAARVATHRLRGRFREALRDEVARTVGDRDEVDDELRHLFSVFGDGNETRRIRQ